MHASAPDLAPGPQSFSVSDSGVHLIACIMIGVSLALALISVLDRTLPGKTGS